MYAHSEFPPFHRVFVLHLIAQINSQNILLMIILRAHILIILIFSGFIGQIIFTITFTSTKIYFIPVSMLCIEFIGLV